MEFDKSIKKNNFKFEFVKEKDNKKKDKKKSNAKEGFGSNIKEGFVDINNKAFEFNLKTFNILTFGLIFIIVPIIGINGIILIHRYASFGEWDWNGIPVAKRKKDNKTQNETWFASNI